MKKLSILIIILTANILYGQDLRIDGRLLNPIYDSKNKLFWCYEGKPFSGVAVCTVDGIIRAEHPYKNGREHGTSKGWWENGQLDHIQHNKNGKTVGKYISYWKDGSIRTEIDFGGKHNFIDKGDHIIYTE